MSIEKLDFRKVTKEKIPYTLVHSKVVQQIKDPDVLAIWVYLLSLPPDWKVNKQQLCNHFGIGQKKMREIFSYLNKSNLIEYSQERDEFGTFLENVIHVLCGDNFEPTGEAEIAPTAPVGQKTGGAVNGTGGFDQLQKKYKNKALKASNKKTKETERALSLFSEDFAPDQEAFQMMGQYGFTEQEALTCFEKFKIHFKGQKAKDWQSKFKIWLIREREHKRKVK